MTCPVHNLATAFDPLDLSDPFPLLAQARRDAPVFYSPEIDYWIVTRYADIKAIFRDHETYTAANTITPIVPFSDAVQRMLAEGGYSPEPVLSNNVPPSHTRIRALVNRLFTPRRIKSFAPAIRDIAQGGVARLINQSPVDIVAELTYEYPAHVLFRVLGVPAADVPQVKAWAGNRIKLYYGRPSAAEQIEMTKNLVPFWRYVVDLVAEKANEPQDDLTSDLIRMRAGDDSVLTLNEIASCMITLLVAGHETTTAQISNALLHLLSQREHWEALGRAPETIPQMLEEMMRFDPSVCAWRRLAVKPSTIAGVEIAAGANLLLMLNAANRDDSVFPQPDLIIATRENLKDHLAFGYGIHYCVGAPLARLEMTILLETLARQLPNCGSRTGSSWNIRAISPSAVLNPSGSPGNPSRFQVSNPRCIIGRTV
ncbi:MAG: cytochrome P450 [Chloroflexi bacterium]|nr:cytochrome P450 [Chloroflexota bacterium]